MASKILNLIHDFSFLVLVAIKSIGRRSNLSNGPSLNKRAMILCNGPSLTSDMPTIVKRRDGADLYCVNSFSLTKYFDQLMPEFCVFADPMYWRNDVGENILENRNQIISALLQSDWPITVICPSGGKPFLTRELAQAQNINVVGVDRNEFHFKHDGFQLFALKYGLVTPNFINVAILALWWCISRRVKKIELYGADFSSHIGLKFDLNSGETVTENQHFYQAEKKEGMKRENRKYPDRPQKKMHERFFQVWLAFHQIYLLAELSKERDLDLVNFSSNTNLDSIRRKKTEVSQLHATDH